MLTFSGCNKIKTHLSSVYSNTAEIIKRKMATKRNPYEVLGVKPNANGQEIKRAYFEVILILF